MFNRAELKQQAKDLMKDRFVQMFLVCLLGGLLCGQSLKINFNVESSQAEILLLDTFHFSIVVGAIGLFAAASIVISLLFTAFIGAPIENGMARYFRNVTLGKEKFDDLLFAFSNNYLHHVNILFYRDIRIFCWSLLLLIPGLIKAYEYAFVDYILIENQNISAEEAIQLSSKMTNGLKWEMFVLDLSFILWNLLASALAVFTLGLSNTAVQVYQNQTHAQLYQWVLDNQSNSYQEVIE